MHFILPRLPHTPMRTKTKTKKLQTNLKKQCALTPGNTRDQSRERPIDPTTESQKKQF